MIRLWSCPSCDSHARTVDRSTPMHPCRGLAGLLVPLVPKGTKAKHERVERGDYVGSEAVSLDGDGRPVMSVVTTRDDGQDCTVFAPAAEGDFREA